MKQNVMLDMQMTNFSYNLNNFSTDMNSMTGCLKPCLTGIECLLRRKCHKFSAAKQAIRHPSASFNQAKYFFGHVNHPFQLKFL